MGADFQLSVEWCKKTAAHLQETYDADDPESFGDALDHVKKKVNGLPDSYLADLYISSCEIGGGPPDMLWTGLRLAIQSRDFAAWHVVDKLMAEKQKGSAVSQ